MAANRWELHSPMSVPLALLMPLEQTFLHSVQFGLGAWILFPMRHSMLEYPIYISFSFLQMKGILSLSYLKVK